MSDRNNVGTVPFYRDDDTLAFYEEAATAEIDGEAYRVGYIVAGAALWVMVGSEGYWLDARDLVKAIHAVRQAVGEAK